MEFPTKRESPQDIIPRPDDGARVDTNPPAFAWMPVEEAAEYRVQIMDDSGGVVLAQTTDDNLFLPGDMLQPGEYTWTVAALDDDGEVLAEREEYSLTLPEGVLQQPYPDISKLLDEVPKEHPRIIFTADELDEIRRSINNGRAEAWERLIENAEMVVDIGVPEAADYDKYDTKVKIRREYCAYFGYIREYLDKAIQILSLAWLIGEDERYAEAAKDIFFTVGDWVGEGLYSVNCEHGDEPGLSACRTLHRAYDWLYHSMTDEEKERAGEICLKTARDNWERIYERRNFHKNPGSSHDGRLIAFIGEQALSLCDVGPREEIEQWLDFSLKAFMTIYPHWGGRDGGWAEGIAYGSAYNSIYLPWVEAIRAVSDIDLWKRPFFSKVRNFFMYCTTPGNEMRPFGDGADPQKDRDKRRSRILYTLMRHHGQRFDDPVAVWIAEKCKADWTEPSRLAMFNMIAEDTTDPQPPEDGRIMKTFRGIGWCAMHSDFEHFDGNVFCLFKSSPFGSWSHQHADQNSFYISAGNRALAIPSGYYGPYYGSDHHADWTRATKAQNAMLVNGEGQAIRDHLASGRIVDFEDAAQISYVCGDATDAYKGKLQSWQRHIFFIRPGLIVCVDDIEAPEEASFQWLLHAIEEIEIDGDAQSVATEHNGAILRAQLFSSAGELDFSVTDEFETPYAQGQPEEYEDERPDQWHFTAESEETKSLRVVAVMAAGLEDSMPEVSAELADGIVQAAIECDAGSGGISVPVQFGADAGTATFTAADGTQYSVES
ncbi:MAG: heparinase II/III family protein [Armatimonadota bacterium]